MYSPVDTPYYTVLPVLLPAAQSALLTRLVPHTRYTLTMRSGVNLTNLSDPVQFVTTVPGQVRLDEIIIVSFILILWAVVLRIFFLRWGESMHAFQ